MDVCQRTANLSRDRDHIGTGTGTGDASVTVLPTAARQNPLVQVTNGVTLRRHRFHDDGVAHSVRSTVPPLENTQRAHDVWVSAQCDRQAHLLCERSRLRRGEQQFDGDVGAAAKGGRGFVHGSVRAPAQHQRLGRRIQI